MAQIHNNQERSRYSKNRRFAVILLDKTTLRPNIQRKLREAQSMGKEMNAKNKAGSSGEKKVCIPRSNQSIIKIDPKSCTGCANLQEPMCVKACRTDMLLPNPEKGKPPNVVYADECCACGCCVHACPNALKGAITMNWPLAMSVRWKRKETGKHYRLRMPNPPQPNPKPPVSGYYPKTKRG